MKSTHDNFVVRWSSALGAALGLAVGYLGRNLLETIATNRVASDSGRECDDDGTVECAVSAVPDAVADTIQYGALILTLYVASAVCGAALLAFGLRWTSQANRNTRLDGSMDPRSTAGPLCVMLGACLLVPTLWVVGSAVASG